MQDLQELPVEFNLPIPKKDTHTIKITTLTIILGLFTSGCATQTAQTFQPFVAEVKDQQALSNDLSVCQTIALDYLGTIQGVDPQKLTSEGLQSTLNGASYFAIHPLAPLFAGAGGVGGEALKEFGLNSTDAKKVISLCLHDKGQKSDKYHVYDPNLSGGN